MTMRTSLLFGFVLYSSGLTEGGAGFISSYQTFRGPLLIISNNKKPQLLSAPARSSSTTNPNYEEVDGRTTLLPAEPTPTRRELIQKLAATVAAAIATSSPPQYATAAISPPLPDAATSSGPTSSASAVCDPTVLSFSKGSRVLHIVGTAHISSESANLAGRLVREAQPDAVFLELDVTRLSRAFAGGVPPPGVRIAAQDENGNLRLGVTPKTGLAERLLIRFVNAASNPSMYRKLEMSGIPVGEEFINAVKAGLDNDALIILGDQSLDKTYQRLAQALAVTGPKKLEELDAKLNAILKTQIPEIEEWERKGGSLRPDQFRELIESMKTVDTTMQLMDTFKKEAPDVWRAMVGERDVYMARGLNALPSRFQTVVAVMGLGHLNGVSRSLKGMRWSALAKSCQ